MTMRIMQQVIRINSIKGRAERIGVSLKALCDQAGVGHSSVYRWLSGETDPRIGNYSAACDRLESTLRARELALLVDLEQLHRSPEAR